MSIDTETWDGLTELAEAIGATRTDLIKDAIVLLVKTGSTPELREKLAILERELASVRRRLAAARAALEAPTFDAEPSVAA